MERRTPVPTKVGLTMRWSERLAALVPYSDEIPPSTRSDALSRQPSLILFSLDLVRTLAILVLIASTSLASSWPGAAYIEVRGYAYNPEVGESIWHDGKLASSVINKSGTLLSTAQTQFLLRAITRKPPTTIDLTNCFSPHHAFVFY